MEEENRKYWWYKIAIDIFGQVITYLVMKLPQIFTILNKKSSIEIIFNESYEFNSS